MPGEPEEGEATTDPGTQLPIIEAPPLHMAASSADVRGPMDATPSPSGDRIFYIALSEDDDGQQAAGVFSVDAGGGDIEQLALGGMLVAPVGISVSLDGERLYIADSGASTEAGMGAILSLSSSGGEPSVVAGTEGYVPRGVVIAEVEGNEALYFTGTKLESGEAGLFRIAIDGGEVETVASGEPFVDPAGVAVTSEGVAYVVDSFAGEGLAAVVRVQQGESERVIERIGVGFPAGIATSMDGASVLVSGLDPVSRRDRVFLMNAETLDVSVVVEPFSEFVGPAGLHRAHERDTFAWADTEANQDGTVYVLEL